MERSVGKMKPTVNNFILAVVAACFLVAEGQLVITECTNPNRSIRIPEDYNKNISFTCDGLSANETAQWTLRLKLNSSDSLSFSCGPPGGSCVGNSAIQVIRLSATSSMLTVLNNHQQYLANRIIFCFPYTNSSNTVNCSVESTTATGSQTQAPPLSTTVQTRRTSTSAAPSVSPTLSSSSTKATGITTEREDNEDDGSRLPVEAIGGGVAALVVILIIIIVVVVVVKRRKRQKAAGNNSDDLEEHVNPMYGSGDEPDTTPPSNSKPSAVALRIPTDTSNNDNNAATLEDADNAFDAGYSSMAFGEQQTVSPSSTPSPDGQSTQNTASQAGLPTNTTTPVVVTDAELYTSVDGMDQEQTSGPVQDHVGGHSTEGGPTSSSTAAPSGDVYAVVQKSGPRAQSASATTTVSPSNPGDSADGAYAFVDVSRSSAPAPSSKAPSDDPVSDNADNTYAVVNKSSSQDKGTGATITPNTSNSSQQAPSGDVYAQVDKSSKRNGSTRENDGEGQSYVYAQVDKPSKGNNPTPVQQTQAQDQKPGIKPKPALKPKPSFNV